MYRSSLLNLDHQQAARHLWWLGSAHQPGFAADDFDALARTGRPSVRAERLEPWAVVESTGERVAVCVSPSFTGGLFWARTPAGLVFSDNVRELVAGSGIRVPIDPDFIRGFAVLSREMAATRTAFAEINRVVPGTTEIWDVCTPLGGSAQECVGLPRTVVWCGPDAWPEPHLQGSGAPHEYLAAFDASIDDLIDEGPLCVC